jgi:hypothetical protein
MYDWLLGAQQKSNRQTMEHGHHHQQVATPPSYPSLEVVKTGSVVEDHVNAVGTAHVQCRQPYCNSKDDPVRS